MPTPLIASCVSIRSSCLTNFLITTVKFAKWEMTSLSSLIHYTYIWEMYPELSDTLFTKIYCICKIYANYIKENYTWKKNSVNVTEFSIIWKLDEKFGCNNRKIPIRCFYLANCFQLNWVLIQLNVQTNAFGYNNRYYFPSLNFLSGPYLVAWTDNFSVHMMRSLIIIKNIKLTILI